MASAKPAAAVAPSVASAAGDRAKLGSGPPCKLFEDLVMRDLREDFRLHQQGRLVGSAAEVQANQESCAGAHLFV